MLKFIQSHRKLVLLIILVVLIRLFSLNSGWVEKYYTYGIYPLISQLLRMLFGWIPFSFGDLLYAGFAVFLVAKLIKYVMLLLRKEFTKLILLSIFRKVVILSLEIYILFNVLWGLNYDRKGIADQLGLEVKPYSKADLTELTAVLQNRMNYFGNQVDSVQRLELNKSKVLFKEAIAAYTNVQDKYPFLTYRFPSVKASLYSGIGQYMGFTGYYNPFSGEAQIKTSVPVFLKPFIINHEIAHQMGYGKENEANFVAFLTCRNSSNIDFKYSVYFELTLYALSDLRRKDSVASKQFKLEWSSRMKYDYLDFLNYLFHNENSVEPIVMRFYDQYLKLNNQPKGTQTYNQVVAWLVAYLKKYGTEAM